MSLRSGMCSIGWPVTAKATPPRLPRLVSEPTPISNSLRFM